MKLIDKLANDHFDIDKEKSADPARQRELDFKAGVISGLTAAAELVNNTGDGYTINPQGIKDLAHLEVSPD